MERELTEFMAAQAGVFTAAQASAAGLTGRELVDRVRRGELRSLRRTVYTTRARWEGADAEERLRLHVAGALVARGWPATAANNFVAGFRTAASLWGLPLIAHLGTPQSQLPPVIELVSPDRRRRTYRAGVHVRPAALRPDEIVQLGSLPVTSLARTAVDLSRDQGWSQAVVACDAALRLGADHATLVQVASRTARWAGGKQGLRAATFADARAESPAESIARAVCAEHGLPLPELQVALSGCRGEPYRVDLFFRDQLTILEADGRVKYTDPHTNPGEVLWREKVREDSLRDAGYEVVRATWHQLTTNPPELVDRIRAAFARSRRSVA